ncbi:hypothetical protein [Methylobacterium sp. JK268]
MAPLYFLHLPRTGGAALRDAARAAFPGRVLTLYGRDDPETHPVAREIVYERSDLPTPEKLRLIADHIARAGIAVFASHLSAAYLPGFDPDRAFTLVREPVAQVLAAWGESGAESLEAFIEDKAHQNTQTRAFGCADLDRLALVGVAEEYAAFVAALNRRFGLAFQVLHREEPPAPPLNPALRVYIERLNASDGDLYRRARERWGRG